jgi:hypothetical protein
MDTSAHRIIHQARSLLVDKLGGAGIVRRDATWQEIAESIGHGLNAEQAQALVEVTQTLFHLMMTDPAPPECQNCAQLLFAGCAHALDARNCPEPGPAPGGCPDARDALATPKTGRPRRFCSDACRQQAAHHAE